MHMTEEMEYAIVKEAIKKGESLTKNKEMFVELDISEIPLSDIIKELKITERDIQILISTCFYKKTYESTGKEYGLTRERIRQIKNRCLFRISKYIIRLNSSKIQPVEKEHEKNIFDLDLSARSRNCLCKLVLMNGLNIDIPLSVIVERFTFSDMKSIKNCGGKSTKEIKDAFEKEGFYLMQ